MTSRYNRMKVGLIEIASGCEDPVGVAQRTLADLRGAKRNDRRCEAIIAAYQGGMSTREIGEIYGFCRQWIGVIIRRDAPELIRYRRTLKNGT